MTAAKTISSAGASHAWGERFHPFRLLVAGIVALMIAQVFITGGPGRIVFNVAFSALMVIALGAVESRRTRLPVAIALTVGVIAFRWIGYAADHPGWVAASLVCAALYLGMVIHSIGAFLIRAERVDSHMIFGGIGVYLLLGLLGAQLLALVEFGSPGSFTIGGETLALGTHGEGMGVLLYYSFVTMTTLGYGDALPTTQGARMLAALLAVVGQLYVAILIGRLVGLHLTSRDA